MRSMVEGATPAELIPSAEPAEELISGLLGAELDRLGAVSRPRAGAPAEFSA